MSYFDNLLKKIPKIKKILDNDKNSTIYHYTKPEKLLNILKSASIRFSNALYLNDKDEIAYSYKLIVKLIDETPNLETDVFEKIKNHFISKYKHIFSMSYKDSTYSYVDYTEIPEYTEEVEYIDCYYEAEVADMTAWESQLENQITTLSTELQEINSYMDSYKTMLSDNIKNDYNYAEGL